MLSLYRRHRPRTFHEVAGQEHIVRTLRNAIELGKVHHAYLFVGSRGTGKTSMAKLLACALNAAGGPNADFDPDAQGCRAILAGGSLDVVEMDAASHNSVDDIRELRENVALAPMEGGRRVYILDEAHMLTTQAWNAFLKTLEEPPPHVVFVLATTEAHKVPATIVDRCHRFDFGRPSLEQIAGVLRRVADEERIELPDAAVAMIARAATGSFRDALGTLEQLVTYGGSPVQLDDVLEVLGVADAELVLDTAESIAARDPRAALLDVGRLSDSGRDVTQFMRDLTAHLRHLFVVQTLGEVPDSFSVTAEHTDRLAVQAERLSQGEIVRAIELLARALAAVKDGSDPRIQLELALLKATQPQADLSLGALLFRIEQLERRLGAAEAEAPAAAATPAAQVAASSQPRPAPAAMRGGGSNAASAAGVRAPAPKGPAAERAATRPVAGAPAAERAAARPVAGAPAAESPAERAEGAPAATSRATPAAATPAAGALAAKSPTPAPPADPPRPRPPAAAPAAAMGAPGSAGAPAVAAPEPEPPAAAPELDLERLRSLWPAVADAVRTENGMVGALLGEARVEALAGGRLTVAFRADAAFSRKKAEANAELVHAALRALTGHSLQVRYELSSEPGGAPAATLSEQELLARLRDEFGAEEIFEEVDDEGRA